MSSATQPSTSSLYHVEKLTAQNFSTWKIRLQTILRDRRVWKHVDGTASFPESGSAKQKEEWEDKDQQAMSQIILTVSDSVVGHLRTAKTSREAWIRIMSLFEQKGLASNIFLRRQLLNIRLNLGTTMQSHINTIQGIADQLDAIEAPVKDVELALTILCSLPESYQPLIIALEALPPNDITFDRVCARLLAEEKRQQESSSNVQIGDVTAYLSQNAKHSRRGRQTIQCAYCSKSGHNEMNCWLKNPDQRPTEKNSDKAVSTFFATAF